MMPRLYRQAPLNSIWEGSGNIQCLDVLRAFAREPETRSALFAELTAAKGGHPAFDRSLARLAVEMANNDELERRSRSLTERLALVLQAALLIRAGNRQVADLFCETRLDGAHGLAFGTLPATGPMAALIQRAWPAAL